MEIISNPTQFEIKKAAQALMDGHLVAFPTETVYGLGADATNENAVQLSGTIPPHDVFVAVLDKRDPNGTGQEAPIWDSLEVRADGFFSPVYNTSNAFYWNGNDAVMLAKGTLTGGSGASVTTATGFAIIDIFGKIGENPANEIKIKKKAIGKILISECTNV